MKKNKIILTLGLLLTAGALSIHAANVTKLNTTTMVNGATDWSSAPATTDVGEFSSTPTAGTLAAMTLGGPLTLGGLQLDSNLAGPLTITDANTLTLGTSGINMLTANKNATLNFPLTLGSSQTWSIGSGRTLTAGGVISDGGSAFGLTKTGTGTLTLTNNNTYTGGTTNTSGTINLDFTGGAANNIIAGSALTLGGGTLNVIGAVSGSSSQTFSSTALQPGLNVIDVGTNGTAVTLNLGALTVTKGATINFSNAAGSIITTTTAGQSGLGVLGIANNPNAPAGYATVGNSDWASTDLPGGTAGSAPFTILPLSSVSGGYTSVSAATTFQNTPNPGSINFDYAANVTGTANQGGATVRFNTPGANTLNGATFWFICGGFLITPNMGAQNVTINGTATWFADYSTAVTQTGVVWQNNPLGYFIINRNVGNGRDNTGAPLSYIQAGLGTVVMNANGVGHSAYIGQTYLNGGFTVIPGDVGLGNPATAALVNLNGGTVVGTNTFTMENTPGVNQRPFAIGSNGGGLAAATGVTMTIDGVISNAIAGTGPLNIGIAASSANGNTQGLLPGSGSGTANTTPVMATGTVALSGANTYSGGTILQSGTLLINGINNLGGAGTYGGVTFNGGTLKYATSASGAGSLDLSSGGSITMASGGGTIDLNGNTVSYANSIGNNGTGSLTVANSASGGALILGGANTYTGGLLVNSGATLLINGSSSAGTVTVNGTLGGTGTIGGNLILNSGAALTLTNGTPLTVSGALTLNNNTVTVNVTGAQLTAGTYTLLNAGNISGTPNPTPGGNAIAGGFAGTITNISNSLKLVVVATGVSSSWNVDANGNWSVSGNWSSGVPQLAGDGATFGTGTAFRTVNLDSSKTNGSITFNNNNSFAITNSANTLTLDNKGNGVGVTITAGTSNSIQTPITLNDTVAATVSSGKSLAVTGPIANGVNGSKTLTINTAGILALSGNNSYGPSSGSVGTTLSGGGTLQVGNNNALGAGDLSMTASSTLQSGAALNGVNNNLIIGSGATATLDNSSANSLTLGGVISGASGSVTKTSNGTITLGSANTYAGNTTINGGFLSISTGGAAGNPSSLGTVPSSFLANNITLNGGGLLGNTTLVVNANRGVTLNGTGLLDAASGAAMTVNGIIAGNANGLIINSGAGDNGAVVLGAANTFNGTIFINAGILSLGNSLALQNSTLIYSNNNGGILDFGTLTAATLGGLSGTNNLNLTNAAAAAVALTVGGNSATTIYTGILGGSGSLTKEGTGALTIGSGATGGGSYTGTTTVNNGTMTLGGIGSILAGGNIVQITGTNGNSTLNVADSAVISTTGQILIADGGLANGSPSAVATLVIENSASVSGGSLSFGAGGPRPGDGSSVTVQDSATLSIPGTFNLYNGASSGNSTEVLNLNGGTTTVGNFLASSGSGTHQSRINFNGGVLKSAANDPSGSTFLPALTGLIVDVTNTLPAIINTAGFTNTIAAVLANATANPDGGLTKIGNGTLILSAANTYNGPTIVSNGTLLVTGSLSTGAVNILTNGTLGGSGTIGGEVTNVAGTLAPGAGNAAAGTTLTINSDVTLLAGSTNNFLLSVDNTTHDSVNASGTITYGGILTITTNATDTTPLAVGNTFTLFNSTASAFAGSFTSIQPAPGPGLAWSNDVANPGSFIVVSNTVTTPPPVAGFSGTPTNIFVTQSVSFTDASTGSITNWVWNFGDGVSVTNNSNAGVNHAYNATGTYTVSLSVSGVGGSSLATSNNYITVKPKVAIGKPVFSGGQLILSGTNGPAGQTYRILSSTNVALPVASWVPVYTNVFASDGSYTYTNAPLTNKATFFKLVSP